MKKFSRLFIKTESGAVTVDWVVLSASVVLLLGAGYGAMETGTLGLTASIASYMTGWGF